MDQRDKKTVYLRLRCTEAERDRVKDYAKKRDMSVSKLLAVALDAYLEHDKK
ncbi:plasmid mobilization protein [Lactobacillus delbrueckii subsp. bulgaricus]